MNIRMTFLTAACTTALLAPAVSFAASEFHPANGERGYTHHPDHAAKSSLTREQVRAETEAGRKAGWLYPASRSGIFPMKTQGASKTSGQMADELQKESAAERRARMELYSGG